MRLLPGIFQTVIHLFIQGLVGVHSYHDDMVFNGCSKSVQDERLLSLLQRFYEFHIAHNPLRISLKSLIIWLTKKALNPIPIVISPAGCAKPHEIPWTTLIGWLLKVSFPIYSKSSKQWKPYLIYCLLAVFDCLFYKNRHSCFLKNKTYFRSHL